MKEAMKALIKELEQLETVITGFDGASNFIQVTLGEKCPYWITVKKLVKKYIPKNSEEIYELLFETSRNDNLWFNTDEGILEPRDIIDNEYTLEDRGYHVFSIEPNPGFSLYDPDSLVNELNIWLPERTASIWFNSLVFGSIDSLIFDLKEDIRTLLKNLQWKDQRVTGFPETISFNEEPYKLTAVDTRPYTKSKITNHIKVDPCLFPELDNLLELYVPLDEEKCRYYLAVPLYSSRVNPQKIKQA